MSSVENITDRISINLISNGDRDAYSTLYKQYYDLLYLYVFSKTGEKELSQDVVHDVFANVWVNRKSLENVSSIKAYLFTSARNKTFDIIAHRGIEKKYIDSLNKSIQNYEASTDYEIREKDLDQYLQNVIEELPPKMKQIFTLSRKDYLNNVEIAEKLNLSIHTINTQIKRALKILRSKVGK